MEPRPDPNSIRLSCRNCKASAIFYRDVLGFELAGTITGDFMGMPKMGRPEAERAAREHLRRMPAWVCRGE